MPTAPTLFYACMSTAGRTEYDSAAFSHKNPGPAYKDHSNLHQEIATAFDAWLTQKHGFHGIVQCGQFGTLDEAKQWLQGRENESRAAGKMNITYVATDWTYDGSSTSSAASTSTPTQGATIQAGPTAPAAASGSTAFFVCSAVSNRIQYDSAVFEAGTDAATGRKMMFQFGAHLSEKYRISGMPRCTPRPTQAAAQAYLQEFSAGVSGGVTQHVATGWAYDHTPAQPATTAAPP
jgi:hypothetical protein